MPKTGRLINYVFTISFLFSNINNGSSKYATTIKSCFLLVEKNETNWSITPNFDDITSDSRSSSYKTFRKRQLAEDEYRQDETFSEYYYDANITELINKYSVPKTWTWVLIFFHCLVFIIGLSGNILVCMAVQRNHSMRTVTNYFIVNLAVADALVLLFCLPFSVVWDVTGTWWFGTVMCKIVLYIQSVSVTVSILTLTFISLDRWYAICFPLKFKSTTGKAKTAICVIWIIALGCEVPETVFLIALPFSKKHTHFTQCVPTWGPKTDMAFMIVKMVLFYWLPLFLMSVAYTQIIRVLWRSGREPHQIINTPSGSRHSDQTLNFAINTNKSTEGQLRSRRKVAKMLLAVVVMFAVCFLPVHLWSILRLAIELNHNDHNIAMSIVFHWLCYANSAVNPIIYNFMSGKFRQEFRSAFFKCSQVNRSNFTRTSTYFYRSSSNNNRQSGRSKTEMVPLGGIK